MFNQNAFGRGFGSPAGAEAAIRADEARATSAQVPRGVRGLGEAGDSASTGGEAAQAAVVQAASVRARLRAALLPEFLTDYTPMTDFQSAWNQLNQLEQRALSVYMRFAWQHGQGLMNAEAYARYDAYRHAVHETQVVYLQTLRVQLYDKVGRTIGDQVMARIPYPGWLPKLEMGTPAQALQGLGNPAVIPIALAVIAALAAVGIVMYLTSVWVPALERFFLTWAQTSAVEEFLGNREQAFATCMQQEGATAEQCSALAAQVVPRAALTEFFNQLPQPDTGLGVFGWIGVAVVSTVFIYAGYKFWQWKRGSSSPAMRGLPASKKRRKVRRGVGSPTPLRSLRDKVPSRYMLEV